MSAWLGVSLSQVAEACRQVWPDRQALEAHLSEGMVKLPYCKYLWLLDNQARQITANASRRGLLNEHFGRDSGTRPYLARALAGAEFSLSDAYISRNARRPSLTAVRAIRGGDGALLGYLGADFDLRELPATQNVYSLPAHWLQLKRWAKPATGGQAARSRLNWLFSIAASISRKSAGHHPQLPATARPSSAYRKDKPPDFPAPPGATV